jgi:hypothetical protein
VVRKFFPLDKNYLLEQAQLELEDFLLKGLIETVKEEYELRNNPLGLKDSYTSRIRDYQLTGAGPLKTFYHNLAGVYRYKFGDNQLTFMWDGTDQLERYRTEWRAFFTKQITAFCKDELFIRAIFDLTVFNNYSQLAENRMNNFMLQTFEVKLRNGIIKVA